MPLFSGASDFSTGRKKRARRQDHTTSPYASGAYVQRAIRVHRISRHVRDDREAPLICRETSGVMPVIWVRTKAEYFCARGWTGFD